MPFDQIGFRTDLGNRPYPEYTKEFPYAVPMVLFGVPAFLLGLNALIGDNRPGIEGDGGFDPDDEGRES